MKRVPLISVAQVFIILLVFVLIYIQVSSQLELPSYTADIINDGIANQDLNFIYKTGGIMLVISLVSVIASIGASFFASRIAVGVGTNLRQNVFQQVSAFTLQEYNRFGAATLITRNTNDVMQVQNFVYMFLRLMLMAPLMMIGGIIKSYREAPSLSFIFVYVVPILVVAIVVIAFIAIPLFKKLQAKLDNVNLVFRENLVGVRVVRAFNRFRHEKQRFSVANKEHVDVAKKVNRIITFIQPLMSIIMNMTAIAVVYYGAVQVSDGNIELGSIFAFLQYSMQILFSIVMVSMIFVMFPRAQASYKRIKEVLDTEVVVTDNNDPLYLAQPEGTIEFDNVSFRYPGAEYPVLENISFTAKPGTVTAIVGGTGSGKSTLINLIPRFYDVSSGSIKFDDHDLRNIAQHSLRKQIGYIPQTAVLFSGDIRENLLFGDKSANDEELKEAIKIAQASEFIDVDNDGLEKHVSQSGTNLSGGQKQRIAIARAIVRKPKVYVFDDSFSALDFATDSNLREAIKPYTKDATVFIVAQRISTITHADQIIVLDEGKIDHIGTHRELLQKSAVYKEIVASQITEEEMNYE